MQFNKFISKNHVNRHLMRNDQLIQQLLNSQSSRGHSQMSINSNDSNQKYPSTTEEFMSGTLIHQKLMSKHQMHPQTAGRLGNSRHSQLPPSYLIGQGIAEGKTVALPRPEVVNTRSINLPTIKGRSQDPRIDAQQQQFIPPSSQKIKAFFKGRGQSVSRPVKQGIYLAPMNESSHRKAPLNKTLLNQSSAQEVGEEFQSQPDSALKPHQTISHSKASRWKTPLQVKKKLTVPNTKLKDNDLSPVMQMDKNDRNGPKQLPQYQTNLNTIQVVPIQQPTASVQKQREAIFDAARDTRDKVQRAAKHRGEPVSAKKTEPKKALVVQSATHRPNKPKVPLIDMRKVHESKGILQQQQTQGSIERGGGSSTLREDRRSNRGSSVRKFVSQSSVKSNGLKGEFAREQRIHLLNESSAGQEHFRTIRGSIEEGVSPKRGALAADQQSHQQSFGFGLKHGESSKFRHYSAHHREDTDGGSPGIEQHTESGGGQVLTGSILRSHLNESSKFSTNRMKSQVPPLESTPNPYFEPQLKKLGSNHHFKKYYSKSVLPSEIASRSATKRNRSHSKEDVHENLKASMHSVSDREEAGGDGKSPGRSLHQVSKMTLSEVQKLIEQNRNLTANLNKTSHKSMVTDEEFRTQSVAQIKYNKKIISLLKQANENLQQFQVIMEESPQKSKLSVVKELQASVQEEIEKDRRYNEKLLESASLMNSGRHRGTNTTLMQHHDTFNSSKKMLNRSLVHQSKELSATRLKPDDFKTLTLDQKSAENLKYYNSLVLQGSQRGGLGETLKEQHGRMPKFPGVSPEEKRREPAEISIVNNNASIVEEEKKMKEFAEKLDLQLLGSETKDKKTFKEALGRNTSARERSFFENSLERSALDHQKDPRGDLQAQHLQQQSSERATERTPDRMYSQEQDSARWQNSEVSQTVLPFTRRLSKPVREKLPRLRKKAQDWQKKGKTGPPLSKYAHQLQVQQLMEMGYLLDGVPQAKGRTASSPRHQFVRIKNPKKKTKLAKVVAAQQMRASSENSYTVQSGGQVMNTRTPEYSEPTYDNYESRPSQGGNHQLRHVAHTPGPILHQYSPSAYKTSSNQHEGGDPSNTMTNTITSNFQVAKAGGPSPPLNINATPPAFKSPGPGQFREELQFQIGHPRLSKQEAFSRNATEVDPTQKAGTEESLRPASLSPTGKTTSPKNRKSPLSKDLSTSQQQTTQTHPNQPEFVHIDQEGDFTYGSEDDLKRKTSNPGKDRPAEVPAVVVQDGAAEATPATALGAPAPAKLEESLGGSPGKMTRSHSVERPLDSTNNAAAPAFAQTQRLGAPAIMIESQSTIHHQTVKPNQVKFEPELIKQFHSQVYSARAKDALRASQGSGLSEHSNRVVELDKINEAMTKEMSKLSGRIRTLSETLQPRRARRKSTNTRPIQKPDKGSSRKQGGFAFQQILLKDYMSTNFNSAEEFTRKGGTVSVTQLPRSSRKRTSARKKSPPKQTKSSVSSRASQGEAKPLQDIDCSQVILEAAQNLESQDSHDKLPHYKRKVRRVRKKASKHRSQSRNLSYDEGRQHEVGELPASIPTAPQGAVRPAPKGWRRTRKPTAEEASKKRLIDSVNQNLFFGDTQQPPSQLANFDPATDEYSFEARKEHVQPATADAQVETMTLSHATKLERELRGKQRRLVRLENAKVNSDVSRWKDRVASQSFPSSKAVKETTVFSNYYPAIPRKQFQLSSLTPIRSRDHKVHVAQIKTLFDEVKQKRNMTKQERRGLVPSARHHDLSIQTSSRTRRRHLLSGERSKSITTQIQSIKDECQVLKHAIFVKEIQKQAQQSSSQFQEVWDTDVMPNTQPAPTTEPQSEENLQFSVGVEER